MTYHLPNSPAPCAVRFTRTHCHRSVGSGERRCFAGGGRGGGGALSPQRGLGRSPENVLKGSIFECKKQTILPIWQGLAASCCLTCSCWLTWLETRTCSLKTKREREIYLETARQEKIESIGKTRRSWTMLDLTGFRLVRRVVHGRSQSLACRESRRTSPSETPEAQHGRTIAFALQQWHVAFSGGSSFFTNWAGLFFCFVSFLFFSFSFSLFFFFFFFGTRLLTLRNLRYVATRLCQKWPFADWQNTADKILAKKLLILVFGAATAKMSDDRGRRQLRPGSAVGCSH